MSDQHSAERDRYEAKLKFMMQDKRYWHPRHADPTFQAMITEGFRQLYPTQKPAAGNRSDADGNGDTGAVDMVHVDAHKRSGIQVSDYFRSRPDRTPGQGGAPDTTAAKTGHDTSKPLPPPDDDNITPEALYDILDFDPNGPGKYRVGLENPTYGAIAAQILTPKAHSATKEEYGDTIAKDDEADAFRHAYISFEMARVFGGDVAKSFGDAHEISHPNNEPERMMDLYNNYVGRELAADKSNRKRPANEVVRQAIQEGRLRLKPYDKPQESRRDE